MERIYHPFEPQIFKNLLCLRNTTIEKPCAEMYSQANVVVGISLHNQKNTLIRCLDSALNQSLVIDGRARILLLDDCSSDSWREEIGSLYFHPALTVLRAYCGSPAKARNAILDYADEDFCVDWVARLDADDAFASTESLCVLWNSIRGTDKAMALGSNYLFRDGDVLGENIADPQILGSPDRLLNFVEAFCLNRAERELPSCNLLIRTRCGLRYPLIRSAEDHWLVLRQLMFFPSTVLIVPHPHFVIYSLGGTDTLDNRRLGEYWKQRQRLAEAAKVWYRIRCEGFQYLGSGMEGVVWRDGDWVFKEFYSWAIHSEDVDRLRNLLQEKLLPIVRVEWFQRAGVWGYRTPFQSYRKPFVTEPEEIIRRYLTALYKASCCTSNIKRDNLIILENGSLVLVDVGRDIVPLQVSRFLDMSARLYSTLILGRSDEELLRRATIEKEAEILNQMPGFSDFYRRLIEEIHRFSVNIELNEPTQSKLAADTSLLIKCCAQDWQQLTAQVEHITTHLSFPQRFYEVVLLVDSFQGPYLRSYASANLKSVLSQANDLLNRGVIQRILFSPAIETEVQSTYFRWFGNNEVIRTHNILGVPLFSQLWAFEQIKTPFVLQCDCDVLIGRLDLRHDYLMDMKIAMQRQGTVCVGFNIAKSEQRFFQYHGSGGQYAPEVRIGLLNLELIYQNLPLPNEIRDDCFVLSWYRSMQRWQEEKKLQTVRGGDFRTFFIHPQNDCKQEIDWEKIRDQVSQGHIPDLQREKVDLVNTAEWKYRVRSEKIVFLLKGRATEKQDLVRCLKSLEMQASLEFGVILIDDGAGVSHTWDYPLLLGQLAERTTLIRHEKHRGRLPNFCLAIEQVCSNPESLIVILDQDDCLMRSDVVEELSLLLEEGADLIHLPVFRTNKPLKTYKPDYVQSRFRGGGNVWTHLRAFKKSLFELVPKSYFKENDSWFPIATDYATMLPMVELAQKPVFSDRAYAYYHNRESRRGQEKENEIRLIRSILTKPPLSGETAVPMRPDSEFC